MSCIHDLAINKEHHDTTACCSYPSKQPILFLHSVQSDSRIYRLWSSQTEHNLQYFSRPGSCYRYHPPNTFRSGRHHDDTTACCGSVPKKQLFHSVQTDWCYTDSGPLEPNITCSTSPGPDLPTDAIPRTRFVLGGPSPRRGNASGFL